MAKRGLSTFSEIVKLSHRPAGWGALVFFLLFILAVASSPFVYSHIKDTSAERNRKYNVAVSECGGQPAIRHDVNPFIFEFPDMRKAVFPSNPQYNDVLKKALTAHQPYGFVCPDGKEIIF